MGRLALPCLGRAVPWVRAQRQEQQRRKQVGEPRGLHPCCSASPWARVQRPQSRRGHLRMDRLCWTCNGPEEGRRVGAGLDLGFLLPLPSWGGCEPGTHGRKGEEHGEDRPQTVLRSPEL